MNNLDTFRQWCQSVVKGETTPIESVTAVDFQDLMAVYNAAGKAQPWFQRQGIKSLISGNGNILENGFSISANGRKFTVYPAKKAGKPTKKGVAQSSRDAYAKVPPTQRLEVARAVIALHGQYEFVSDNLVSREVKHIPSNRVSARRNEIEEKGWIEVDGVLYVFTTSYKHIKCPVTGSSVNGWALRKPATLF